MRAKYSQIIFAILLAIVPSNRQSIYAQDTQAAGAAVVGGSPSPASPCSIDSPRSMKDGISAPIVVYAPAPKFSEQARAAAFQGIVLVAFVVDTCGHTQNVHVLQGVGMGLDENAVAAVQQYIFKAATKDGVAVPVLLNAKVNFQIFPSATVIDSVPIVITSQARSNHASGTIVVGLTVDETGKPTDVHIVRGVGMGMDLQAIVAVRQYTFKPFMRDGKPAAQAATVEVKFDATQ